MKLQFKIQKVNIEENKRIIVVSDIHGMDHYLEGVLQKVDYTTEDLEPGEVFDRRDTDA